MEILDCAFVEMTCQVASPTHRMDIQNNQTDILWAIISTTSCYEGKNAPSHQGSKTANPSFSWKDSLMAVAKYKKLFPWILRGTEKHGEALLTSHVQRKLLVAAYLNL